MKAEDWGNCLVKIYNNKWNLTNEKMLILVN